MAGLIVLSQAELDARIELCVCAALEARRLQQRDNGRGLKRRNPSSAHYNNKKPIPGKKHVSA